MIRALIVFLLLGSVCEAKHPYDSVVRVNDKSGGGGSGILIAVEGDKGLIATNAHVVGNDHQFRVHWTRQNQTRLGKTIHVDVENDFALLVVSKPPTAVVELAEEEELEPGQPTFSAGYPYYDRAHLHWQPGMFYNYHNNHTWITSRPVPGMSGGALLTQQGKLIGVVRAVYPTLGIAVNKEVIQEALEDHPAPWTPNKDHVRPPSKQHKFTFAERDNDRRSVRYAESTAPDLE